MFRKKETQDISEEKKQALLAKIKPIIAQQLKIGEGKVIYSARFKEDLEADSLDAIEIVMAIEEAFNIEILDEESEQMKTVEDIILYLAQKIKI